MDGPGDENCVNTLRYSVAVCRGPDAESNARLIAAAPEIRKAAEFALSTLESLDPHGKKDGQTPQAKELLEQAIAKAEGEEVER